MEQYISKSSVVEVIEKRKNICKKVVWDLRTQENKDYYQGKAEAYKEVLDLLDTLEVKEDDSIVIPYDARIQYVDRESAIKAHAEDYSWNIESELFQQLTPEQQKLWRKDIEQACISGGYCGLNLQKDSRYDDSLGVKVDLKKEIDDFMTKEWEGVEEKDEPLYSMIKNDLTDVATHFFELGMTVSNKEQKGK